MDSIHEKTNSSNTLRRELGLGSAAAAVAGECIAVGIFLTPAGMAHSLGSPFWLLLVWILVGTMTLLGALCYTELTARFPRAGGPYVYLYEAFGPSVAFLYGWMSLAVLDPGITAVLATGVSAYFAFIVHLSPLGIKILSVALIWTFCFINIRSARLSAGFLRWLTWLKFGVLLLIIVWAIVFRLGAWSNFIPFVPQRAGSLPLAPALGAAMVAAFFSFAGWWDVSKIAGEIRDPVKTLPRALILGVLAVTVAYVLISTVFLYLVPLEKVSSDETFVAQVGQVLFGQAGGIIFAAIVVLCVLGSMAVSSMAAPRVFFAMAADGIFLPSMARLHPRYHTPSRAIAVPGAIATLLVAIGTFQQIISYFIFVAVFFLGLSVAGLFVLRRRSSAAPPVRTPGYPFTPIAFLVMVLGLLVLLVLHAPREAALGSAVVLAGAPVYYVFRSRRRVEG
jgi:basic amino acid/polyamine antiporter, APA family